MGVTIASPGKLPPIQVVNQFSGLTIAVTPTSPDFKSHNFSTFGQNMVQNVQNMFNQKLSDEAMAAPAEGIASSLNFYFSKVR
ncbi:MAG: hypothetical protein ACIWVG_30435 [Gloeotrichia echinulata HAB0833]